MYVFFKLLYMTEFLYTQPLHVNCDTIYISHLRHSLSVIFARPYLMKFDTCFVDKIQAYVGLYMEHLAAHKYF